jgi:hypothetical protein
MFFKNRFDFVRTSFNKIKYQLSRLEPLLTKLNISLAGWSQFFFTLLICTWQNREGI